MAEYTDIKIRCVKGYGYMPIICEESVEIYRGEFSQDVVIAFAKALRALADHIDTKKQSEEAKCQ